MLLSCTRSIARGQAGKYNDFSGDNPALHDTARGFLDYDQRHVLKWQGVTHLPHGLILGGTVLWTSGIPYSVTGFVDDYDDLGNLNFRDYFPTGFKNDQRNAGQWTLDARIEKRFTMGRVEAGAFLSGENLLDSDDVTIYSCRQGSRDGHISGGKRFGRRWEMGGAFSF